ncbi:MAG: hypothetical protein R2731_03280 [Nocardioides sp.]
MSWSAMDATGAWTIDRRRGRGLARAGPRISIGPAGTTVIVWSRGVSTLDYTIRSGAYDS